MSSAPLRFLLVLFVAFFLAPARLFPADPPAATAAATPAATGPRFASEIAAFEKSDAEHPPEKGAVLFIGSSSIRLWKTLAQDFPDQHVLNRGFGGSEISDSIAYADRIVVPYAPRLIVFYAGGNDIHGGKSAERVADDFKAFVEKVRAKLPNEPIDYISIAGNPARWAEVEKVKAANASIAQFCHDTPGLKFIDVYTHMLGADGLPRPEIFGPDKLHMNAEGYKLWTGIIGPYLQ